MCRIFGRNLAVVPVFGRCFANVITRPRSFPFHLLVLQAPLLDALQASLAVTKRKGSRPAFLSSDNCERNPNLYCLTKLTSDPRVAFQPAFVASSTFLLTNGNPRSHKWREDLPYVFSRFDSEPPSILDSKSGRSPPLVARSATSPHLCPCPNAPSTTLTLSPS